MINICTTNVLSPFIVYKPPRKVVHSICSYNTLPFCPNFHVFLIPFQYHYSLIFYTTSCCFHSSRLNSLLFKLHSSRPNTFFNKVSSCNHSGILAWTACPPQLPPCGTAVILGSPGTAKGKMHRGATMGNLKMEKAPHPAH